MMTIERTHAPLTAEEAARIAVDILEYGRGRISDNGETPRPWFFLITTKRSEAMALYEAFDGLGFVKPLHDGYGWRYGAWGNEALEVFEYLLDAGLWGPRAALVTRLLDKYGDNGRSWASEVERLRAQGGPRLA
jgi:hypothetical protein